MTPIRDLISCEVDSLHMERLDILTIPISCLHNSRRMGLEGLWYN